MGNGVIGTGYQIPLNGSRGGEELAFLMGSKTIYFNWSEGSSVVQMELGCRMRWEEDGGSSLLPFLQLNVW